MLDVRLGLSLILIHLTTVTGRTMPRPGPGQITGNNFHSSQISQHYSLNKPLLSTLSLTFWTSPYRAWLRLLLVLAGRNYSDSPRVLVWGLAGLRVGERVKGLSIPDQIKSKQLTRSDLKKGGVLVSIFEISKVRIFTEVFAFFRSLEVISYHVNIWTRVSHTKLLYSQWGILHSRGKILTPDKRDT